MTPEAKIYVAGHKGLVGSAITRALHKAGYHNLVERSISELDLCDAQATTRFFEAERPDYVFLAAAKVGGILANRDFPADFIRDNLAIEINVIDGAYRAGAKKLLFLGSSCIYPKLAPQPIKEEYLLSGYLEPTNDAYAIAKIAGLKMCQSYRRQYGWSAISLMPTNLYGIGDNFDLANSHVLPALMRKFHEAKLSGAKEVVVWGSGKPLREFLFADDLADAALFLMNHYDDDEIVNVGVGVDLTIAELAAKVKEVVGFQGELVYDASKPDGTPRKLLDVSKLTGLGWVAPTSLDEGLRRTYEWFLSQGVTDRQPAGTSH